MSTKIESAKLKELKTKSVSLIKSILEKKPTGGGDTTGGVGDTGGIDGKKGITGPLISGKGNFDDLFKFLIKAPIDKNETIKKKLATVYNYINTDSPDGHVEPGGSVDSGLNPAPVQIDATIPETEDVTVKIKSIANKLNDTIQQIRNIYENNRKENETPSDINEKVAKVRAIVKDFETFLNVNFDNAGIEADIEAALKQEKFTQRASFKLQIALIKAAENKVNGLTSTSTKPSPAKKK